MNKAIAYIKQVMEELQKVAWPGRKEVVRLTAVVILASLIAGIYLSGLDFVFTKFLGAIIG